MELAQLPLISMNKKKGFTLVEVLVSLLIISAVGLSAIYITNGYLKNTYLRDVQTKEMIQNIDTIERLKADVKTQAQLQAFINSNPNIGSVAISTNLYKIDVGINKKLTFVMRVGADGY